MTNGEKYKTAHERSEAFRKFCGEIISKHSCAKCILHNSSYDVCHFVWLELEYEEELKPCPFCGGKAGVVSGIHKGCEYHWVECSECYGRSIGTSLADRTIASWNRRV